MKISLSAATHVYADSQRHRLCVSARAPRGVYFLPSWEVELLAAFDWPGAVACHSAWRWPAFAAVRDGSRMALDWLKQCNPLLTRPIFMCLFGGTAAGPMWRICGAGLHYCPALADLWSYCSGAIRGHCDYCPEPLEGQLPCITVWSFASLAVERP